MPEPLDDVVRLRMKRQARRDTSVELEIRRRLHALGYRYRVDHRLEPSLRCRGDIVFTRRRVVVFVDGCFWHGCPDHATAPKNNAEWWRQKLAANFKRDERNRQALEGLGWTVIGVWEHEDPGSVTARIVDVLGVARTGG
ncbi:very short patch repair endonuclease [Nocardioides sp. QY071]|uniref:very short patch repair endonuclease n=1 Tax=Nocardioides sp. QY071 TaxID=3044187 RepID=UPI00249B2862|nr:very short patch repair endonuclease [Nocardioides sp. QY071]WGY02177.1 very short patch repair endonuclease [Nocardioides sp. QY071]